MDEINERLDRICENIGRAQTLNALHACRPGHPLNKDNDFCWRNAQMLVAQLDGFTRRDIDPHDILWLEKMARKEQRDAQAPLSENDGLRQWVRDYKTSRAAGNVALAQQIRDNIDAEIVRRGLDRDDVYGPDPDDPSPAPSPGR